MDSESETILLKTKPSILVIVTGLMALTLFSGLTYLIMKPYITGDHTILYNGKPTILNKNSSAFIIIWSFIGVLIASTVYTLWCIIGLKTIVLTDKNLVIKRPILLLKKVIPLNEIKNIEDGTFELKILLLHSWDYTPISTGNKITIELNTGKKIKLTSYEISHFSLVTKKLNTALRKMREIKRIRQ